MSETTLLPEDFDTAGEIPWTARAKRSDAYEAMGKDLIRALVELITNADDSYDDAGRFGPIEIEAEHARRGEYSRVIVRDHAAGMSPDDVVNRLIPAGKRASGHAEGRKRRGLHGRGAKDVSIFGNALFKTINFGNYTEVEFHTSQSYRVTAARPAQDRDYPNIGIAVGGSGTEVTIFVRRSDHGVPQHRTILDRLSHHVQLRDILRTPEVVLTVKDLGKGLVERLQYKSPYPLTPERGPLTLSLPGYPGVKPQLVITRSAQPFDDVRNQYRDSGIEIVGRRAVFEATYFGLEGRPGALSFSGRLDCPFIDDLQDDFDSRHEEDPGYTPLVLEMKNPIPIISRRREGLALDHPFTEALKSAVETVLLPLVQAEEGKAASEEPSASAETRRRLRTAEAVLGRVFQEILREQDVDDPDHGAGTGTPLQPTALEIVPDAFTLIPDETKVFSVFAWPESHEQGVVVDGNLVSLRVADTNIVTLHAATVQLEADRKVPARLRGTFRVTAQDTLDATTLEAQLGPYSADAVIEVVELEPPEPVSAPERLTFHQEAYSSKVERKRRVLIWAPTSLGLATPALVVRTNIKALSCSAPTPFEEVSTDDGTTWLESVVEIEGKEAASGKLFADCGGQTALARVTITDPEGQNPFQFDLVPKRPRYKSAGRAEVMPLGGVRKIVIYGLHDSLAPHFGPKLEKQNTQICQTLIAEVICEALTRDIMQRKEQAGAEKYPDVHAFGHYYNEYQAKLLDAAGPIFLPELYG